MSDLYQELSKLVERGETTWAEIMQAVQQTKGERDPSLTDPGTVGLFPEYDEFAIEKQADWNTTEERVRLWNSLSDRAKTVATQILTNAEEQGLGKHGGLKHVMKRLRVDCRRLFKMRRHHVTAAINELREYAHDLGHYA
jgi:hypothetical protein